MAIAKFVALGLWAFVATADAQTQYCGPYSRMVRKLTVDYFEHPVFRWVGPQGVFAYEFWYSDVKQTASMLRIDRRGVACLVAAAEGVLRVPKDGEDGGHKTLRSDS